MSWRQATARWRPVAARWAGPALIVGYVLFALRGFLIAPRLTNEHLDLLSFWLPRWSFLGRELAAGRIPVWNPYEMLGYRFAADPQSGWLYLPPMALFSTLGPATAMRAMLVLHPLVLGTMVYALGRIEGLGRTAATVGGLSAAAIMSTSELVLSMPFAGTLAWTSVALVALARFVRARRTSSRIGWAAAVAIAWSQVASAHLSHGLVVASLLLACVLVGHALSEPRARRVRALGRGALLLAFLPIASLAILVPRIDLIGASSLRSGYAALEALDPPVLIGDRAIQTDGVWAGWPYAFAAAPGGYAGAAALLAIPFALRARRGRPLALAVSAAFALCYIAMLDAIVTGPIGDRIAAVPFGDTLVHNPGRLRHVAVIALPLLAAIGVQGLLDRPPARPWRWLGAGVAAWLLAPLLAGGYPPRWALFAAAGLLAAPALVGMARARPRAPVAVVAVLALELVASSVWSGLHHGFAPEIGLEGETSQANKALQPLQAPDVDLEAFLAPTAFVPMIGDDRYLTWAPPAAAYQRGYLTAQEPTDWPALTLERGTLFGLRDVLGYNPLQLERYWRWIRAINPLPLFYNATSVQRPSRRIVETMGVRYLIVPERVPSPVAGRVIATADGYDLVEVASPPPPVSVVARWRAVADVDAAIAAVLEPRFDPLAEAVVEGSIEQRPVGGANAGRAEVTQPAATEVVLDVRAEAPSIAVVRTSFEEGWSATVDGRPTEVLPADGFLLGVPVPEGRHVVRITYRDEAIGVGLVASGIAWSAWAVALALARVVERRRRRALSPPPPRPLPAAAAPPR